MKRVERLPRTCVICKKVFFILPNDLKSRTPKYCSNKCWGKYLTGKPTWNKGKKGIYSLEARKNMSEAQKRLGHTGEKCHNWRGGSWVYWQSAIKKRDHYTCIICGLYDPDIVEAAHKKPITGLKNRTSSGHPLNSYENLVTLCPNCHTRYDRGLIVL